VRARLALRRTRRDDRHNVRLVTPTHWEDLGTLGLKRRSEEVIGQCDKVIDLTAALFGVPSKEIRKPGRADRAVTRLRQMAMYVSHVELGLPMHDVATGFQRERTTVLHACHQIEDLRDDIDFDAQLIVLERVVSIAINGKGEP
jgi:hypothetical protein